MLRQGAIIALIAYYEWFAIVGGMVPTVTNYLRWLAWYHPAVALTITTAIHVWFYWHIWLEQPGPVKLWP